MSFRVRIRTNRNTIEKLDVASSQEQFENFTIRELKEKSLRFFPGLNVSHRPRVIFVNNELEDDQTFKSCNIQQLSVLVMEKTQTHLVREFAGLIQWKVYLPA